MTNQPKFWVKCHNCQRIIGVSPDIVLKYVDRLLGQLTGRFTNTAAKATKEAKENEGK